MFIDWDAIASRLGWIRVRHQATVRRYQALPAVAFALISLIAIAGFTRFESWPIGVYPTFAFLAPSTHSSIELSPLVHSRPQEPVNGDAIANLRDHFGSTRWSMLLERIVWSADSTKRRQLTLGIMELLQRSDAAFAGVRRFQLNRTTRSVDPSDWSDAPIRKEYLGEVIMPQTDDGP